MLSMMSEMTEMCLAPRVFITTTTLSTFPGGSCQFTTDDHKVRKGKYDCQLIFRVNLYQGHHRFAPKTIEFPLSKNQTKWPIEL